MTRKLARESRGMLFTWGVLVGLIFLFTPKSLTGRLQLLYAQVFRWPLEAGRGLTIAARTTTDPETAHADRSGYEQLRAEKKRLEIDRANLQAKLQEACKRIDDLAKLRNKPGWENMGFLSANVLPAGQTQNQLIINQGRKAGVAVGQFVASPDGGIVGAVTETSSQVATIRLITDPASKIPVYIGDPNVRGIMEGRGNGLARIPRISTKHNIRAGDHVYIQKKAGWLDAPTVAAEVAQCGPDADSPVVLDITARPICEVANLSEVVVLVPAAKPQ